MSSNIKILGFLCNWCSYAGADLAGISRIQYPPSLRVLRVMCSGRVDPQFVIQALEMGADGVIIMGCHPGDCHYLTGNYEAQVKFELLQKLLTHIGFNRVRLEWVSASEGVRFGEVITEFTEYIKKLGPSPLRDKKANPELLEKLQLCEDVVKHFRIRALIGRQRKISEEGNVYKNKISEKEIETLVDNAIKTEFIRSKIYRLLKNEPLSVKLLAERLKLDSYDILKHVTVLRQRGLIGLNKIDGVSPHYMAIGV